MELNGDKPDLSYIRGMLEVLLAMQEKPKVMVAGTMPPPFFNLEKGNERNTDNTLKDEGSMLDAKAKANLDIVKKFTHADN